MPGRDLLTLNLVEKHPPSSELQETIDTSWSQWEAFRSAAGTDDALFTGPLDRTSPKRLRWLGVSLVIQALVLGFWLLHSVTSESELPPPRVVKTFLTVAPLAPTPPPPPPMAAASPPTPTGDTGAHVAAAVAPPMRLAALTPTSMPLEIATDLGFGFEDGVEAGVPGGVIGGLVGGPGEAPAPLPLTEPTIYVVSGELERPDKLVHVDPVYPSIATVARVEGVVILEAVIDGDGNVEEIRVLRSVPLLDDAALDAVKHWKYEPTIIGGKAVPIQMTVTVRFALA